MQSDTTTCATREHLLATAEPLLLGRGFTALGITEILTAAGVPKGSFYHHFRSKEHFGEALLLRYFDTYDLKMQALFADAAPGPMRARLLAYFTRWLHNANVHDCHGSCLAVKLAGEVSDLSEAMRLALATGMARVVMRLADAIEAGVADGSLAPVADPAALADALYSMWLGAALRTKVRHDAHALEQAMAETQTRLPPGTTPIPV